jgi:transcriptional regulator with XRE-family HTH domain
MAHGETFESRPIGEYLRRQRVLRGMSAEELSDLTRIPLRSLERLESGQFDGETDGFVRGFVRTVALALGLDSDDTLARMLQEPEASAWERHGPGRSTKQIFAAVVALLLLAFAALGLRAIWGLLLGDASQPASREVVIWRDPVHSLAEATGEEVDPRAEIGPRPNTSRTERARRGLPSGFDASDASDASDVTGRKTERRGEGDALVLAP